MHNKVWLHIALLLPLNVFNPFFQLFRSFADADSYSFRYTITSGAASAPRVRQPDELIDIFHKNMFLSFM